MIGLNIFLRGIFNTEYNNDNEIININDHSFRFGLTFSLPI